MNGPHEKMFLQIDPKLATAALFGREHFISGNRDARIPRDNDLASCNSFFHIGAVDLRRNIPFTVGSDGEHLTLAGRFPGRFNALIQFHHRRAPGAGRRGFFKLHILVTIYFLDAGRLSRRFPASPCESSRSGTGAISGRDSLSATPLASSLARRPRLIERPTTPTRTSSAPTIMSQYGNCSECIITILTTRPVNARRDALRL